jgi:hypothetical protein
LTLWFVRLFLEDDVRNLAERYYYH